MMEENANQQKESLADANNSLYESFTMKRVEWNVKLDAIFEMLKDLNQIPTAQIYLYTYRQQVLDVATNLQNIYSKVNQKYKEKYSEKYDFYAMHSDFRYERSSIGKKISGSLSVLEERLDVLDSQVKFYNETLKTIDQALYGIQQRIKIAEFNYSLGGLQKT